LFLHDIQAVERDRQVLGGCLCTQSKRLKYTGHKCVKKIIWNNFFNTRMAQWRNTYKNWYFSWNNLGHMSVFLSLKYLVEDVLGKLSPFSMTFGLWLELGCNEADPSCRASSLHSGGSGYMSHKLTSIKLSLPEGGNKRRLKTTAWILMG
jgi:hypothetical protein